MAVTQFKVNKQNIITELYVLFIEPWRPKLMFNSLSSFFHEGKISWTYPDWRLGGRSRIQDYTQSSILVDFDAEHDLSREQATCPASHTMS